MSQRGRLAAVRRLEAELTWGKVGGLWACIIGSALIVMFCWHEGSMIFSLLALSGAILGWLLGVLIVPYDEREAKSFSVFIKVISGFVTGYLLSKVDPLLTSLLTIDLDTGTAPIAQDAVAKRVLITLASFGISLLTVFSARAYWSAKGQDADDTGGAESTRSST